MEDAVIKLHNLARETKDGKIAKMIRIFADEVSDVIKKERSYGQRS